MGKKCKTHKIMCENVKEHEIHSIHALLSHAVDIQMVGTAQRVAAAARHRRLSET